MHKGTLGVAWVVNHEVDTRLVAQLEYVLVRV